MGASNNKLKPIWYLILVLVLLYVLDMIEWSNQFFVFNNEDFRLRCEINITKL